MAEQKWLVIHDEPKSYERMGTIIPASNAGQAYERIREEFTWLRGEDIHAIKRYIEVGSIEDRSCVDGSL